MGRNKISTVGLDCDLRLNQSLDESNRDTYLKKNKDTRKKELSEEMIMCNTFKGGLAGETALKQVNGSGYFSQGNVKMYQRAFITHLFSEGKPKKIRRGSFFDTVEEFNKWASEFFMLCYETEIVPTISGLACWLKVDRRTLYEHANNPNSQFHDCCAQAIQLCHVSLENGASENKLNSVAYIFQAKNYFGMRDTTDVQIQARPFEEINTTNTLDALKEQKERELSALTIDNNIIDAEIMQ